MFSVAPRLQGLEDAPNGAVRANGFSLHAGVGIAANQRPKLERLCRYVSRPAVASERLALSASGQVRYHLKTPYRGGTTHIVLECHAKKLRRELQFESVGISEAGICALTQSVRVQITRARHAGDVARTGFLVLLLYRLSGRCYRSQSPASHLTAASRSCASSTRRRASSLSIG